MEGKKVIKEDSIWMPYHEYVLQQYYQGKATQAEYDLALEYHFEMRKTEKGIDFKQWLEQRNV
jgi:hypothetical protein